MGELLKVVLTVIVAIGGLYALRLNANRIKVMSKGNTDTRFNNAVSQLGSENEAVALGGVYALHEIARENEETYLEVVHDILCGYVRSESVARYRKFEKEKKQGEKLIPSIVIQAIISLLFPRKNIKERLYDDFRSHLYNSILINYNFYGTKINRANFNGAKIDDCFFTEAKMSDTLFIGTKLTDCNFKNAEICYSQFRGIKINNQCNFDKAILNNSNFHNTQIHDEHKIWEIIKKNKSNILDRFVEDLRNPDKK